MLSFAAPLIARIAAPHSPARVLVVSELLEASLSVAALLLLWVGPPSWVTPVLAGYLLLAAIFPAVTDIVEEFFAQQIAQLDAAQALKFNTTIYSILSFVGIVVGMPLGSALAGVDLELIILVNAVASTCGLAFRLVSARAVIVGPVSDQDPSEFSMKGAPMPLRSFFKDLLASGPTSPAVGFFMQVGGTACGIFLYLSVAQQMPWEPAFSLAIVLAIFGVGATIGPWFAPLARRRFGLSRGLLVTYAALLVTLLAFAVVISVGPQWGWSLALVAVCILGILSRVRSVLTTTIRQTSFRGKRFTRIMSWGVSAGALGGIVGSWLGVLMNVPDRPILGLGVYFVLALGAGGVVMNHVRNSEGNAPLAKVEQS